MLAGMEMRSGEVAPAEVRISAVMHRSVVTVGPQTCFQEVARILVGRRAGTLPVVDAERHVLGVISADLLLSTRPTPFSYSQRASRVAPGYAAGRTAAELMSTPPLLVHPDTTVGRVAELMQAWRLRRLPVTDEQGRLLGMVAESDLLDAYLRPPTMARVRAYAATCARPRTGPDA